jgi:hypothetical protein
MRKTSIGMKHARGLAAVTLVAAVAAGVLADGRACAEDVESLIHKGVELRRQGKEREALEMFQRAAKIKETPRVSAQMGFAEQALGKWVDAEAHLKAALDAEKDPWIAKNRPVIQEAQRTVALHLGSLEVWGDPAGAEILVDGQPAGALPSSGAIRLPLGEVTVTVRQPGYAEVTRVVQIRANGLMRENVTLHALPPAAALQAKQGGAGTGEGGTALEHQPLAAGEGSGTAADTGEGHPVYKKWWFWTLIGAAAVGAGVGVFLATHRGTTMMGCDPGVQCGTWASGALSGGGN